MSAWVWIVIAAVIVVAAVLALGWWRSRGRRTERLREGFGPEYDRTVERAGDRSAAEADLLERERRHEALDLHPLDAATRQRLVEEWRGTQGAFVDDPGRGDPRRRPPDPAGDARARLPRGRLRGSRGASCRSIIPTSSSATVAPTPSRRRARRGPRAPRACAARSRTTGRCSCRSSTSPQLPRADVRPLTRERACEGAPGRRTLALARSGEDARKRRRVVAKDLRQVLAADGARRVVRESPGVDRGHVREDTRLQRRVGLVGLRHPAAAGRIDAAEGVGAADLGAVERGRVGARGVVRGCRRLLEVRERRERRLLRRGVVRST